MSTYVPPSQRAIPPQPTVAWFVRDLILDGLWDEFDIGKARVGEIDAVRRALVRHGGAQAWLRFIGETRIALPQILSISLFDTLQRALGTAKVWPDEIRLEYHPLLFNASPLDPLRPKLGESHPNGKGARESCEYPLGLSVTSLK